MYCTFLTGYLKLINIINDQIASGGKLITSIPMNRGTEETHYYSDVNRKRKGDEFFRFGFPH